MIDYIKDIVKHCSPFDPLSICKITGTPDSTTLLAMNEKGTVVIRGTFHQPLVDFIGVFGLLELNHLNALLNIPEYSEGAKIALRKQLRNGVEHLDGLDFENNTDDFNNFHRFVARSVIENKTRDLKDLATPPPSMVFEPSVQSIQRLKFQAQAYSGDGLISVQSVRDELKFRFGDSSSHEGSYTFHKFTDGKSKLSHVYMWAIDSLQAVLALPGDKEISIIEVAPSALMIVKVDSGLGVYEYKFPSQSK
jgi:hypothetical protein